MKKQTLSDKMELGIVTHTNQKQYYWIKEEKVREFIKDLKEKVIMIRSGIIRAELNEAIDELAGEKLTNGN